MEQKKLYVGNLPYEVTSKELIELFSKFGEILEAMIIPSKNNPTKSKGFGFVTFAREEGAKAALELNGKDFKGRKLVVAVAKQEKTIYESGN